MRRVLVAAVVVATGTLMAVSVPTVAATSGTWVLTESTILTEDHYGEILIAADGITLDGAGYTVYGSGSGGIGVDALGRTGVTIKNVHVVTRRT